MKNHILRKQLTTNLLFVFIGIFFLLSNTIPCSAQSKKPSEIYKAYIKIADQAFAAKDYEGALPLYKKANETMPEYNYASDKINEINKILEADQNTIAAPATQSKNSATIYKTLVAQADYALAAKDYAGALLFYEKAYQTKPDYYYAPDKIDEINLILSASPDLKIQLYENTISKAENLYSQNNYQQAKSEYQKALLIDPIAQIPKDKLKQINSIYIDPDDLGNFNIAVANGDKELADADFENAILFYEAALAVHPNAKFVTKKVADAKKQQADSKARTDEQTIAIVAADKLIQSEKPTEATSKKEKPEPVKTSEPQLQSEQKKYATGIAVADNTSTKEAFDIAIKNGDQSFNEKKYDLALSYYHNALSLIPGEKYPSKKIEEITTIAGKQKESDENYSKSIAEADKQFNENRYEAAISSYTKALGFKPAEIYPQQKITAAQSMLAASKSRDENYAAAIVSGDRLLSELKYNEALNAYKQASSIKPNETYPIDKTAGINSILAKQKSVSDTYAQAIRTGEKALAAGNYSLALTSFQDAQKIKPSEKYPMEQITEIKAITANLQRIEEKYSNALKTGDQLFAGKEYNSALTAYSEAAGLKKNEKYPQDQIAKINRIIADSWSVDENYSLAIKEGDKLFGTKDYSGAKSSFAKATQIKPTETYPRQRIIEIDKIIETTAKTHSSEYKTALELADKLYITKVFDKAIDAYESAAKINPGDAYPELQIGKIRKYMSDHAILDIYSQPLIISSGNEKKFTFSSIDPGLRKNNYILLKARSTGKTVPKVYLNYGKDNQKNGGIVLRNLDKSTISDYIINLSIQDKWFREENNWVSISVETGDIEITKLQISGGD